MSSEMAQSSGGEWEGFVPSNEPQPSSSRSSHSPSSISTSTTSEIPNLCFNDEEIMKLVQEMQMAILNPPPEKKVPPEDDEETETDSQEYDSDDADDEEDSEEEDSAENESTSEEERGEEEQSQSTSAGIGNSTKKQIPEGDPVPEKKGREEFGQDCVHCIKYGYEEDLADMTLDELHERFKLWNATDADLIAPDCEEIMGMIEDEHIFNTEYRSSLRRIAAFGVLICVFGKGVIQFVQNPYCYFFYTLLKYGCPNPFPDAKLDLRITDLEMLVLLRLIYSDSSCSIWTDKLRSILQLGMDELTALTKSGKPVLDFSKPQIVELMTVLQNRTARRLFLKERDDPERLKHIPWNEKMLLEALQSTAAARKLRNQRLLQNKMEYLVKKIGPGAEQIFGTDVDIDDFFQPPLPPLHEAENEVVELEEPSSDPEPEEPDLVIENENPPKENESNGDGDEEEEDSTEAQQLLQQALKEALSITQRQLLLDKLQSSSNLIYKLELTPELLPELVENNPLIAIEVLLKRAENGDDMQDFLEILINMPMSVHSMEVVNRLTNSVSIPKKFLYLYISKCIQTCEDIQDKYIQNRLVRLLCVFLQSLIRNQIIDFQNLYIEILTFCVEFSRIREAAALFRLMKQIESEDPELKEVLMSKLESHQELLQAVKNIPTKDKDPKL